MARVLLRNRGRDRRIVTRNRQAFYANAWQDAAARVGATTCSLGEGIIEITNGERMARVCASYSPLDDPVTLQLAVNKPIINKLLAKEGVPIPEYIRFRTVDIGAIRKFLEDQGGVVVVKPAYGSAGEGVTTNVRRLSALLRAVVWSKAFCPETVIEQQIAGDNYRLLYLDGELLDCVIRRPPSVTGDGKSSIRRLVGQENRRRIEDGFEVAQALLTIDIDMRNTLKTQGMTLRTVPSAGQVVKVKTVINGNRGDDNEDASDALCASIKEMGRRIVKTVGIRLAGVDIITKDPGKDLAETGGVVIEINGTPGLYYHYHRKGRPFEAAVDILRSALRP